MCTIKIKKVHSNICTNKNKCVKLSAKKNLNATVTVMISWLDDVRSMDARSVPLLPYKFNVYLDDGSSLYHRQSLLSKIVLKFHKAIFNISDSDLDYPT
jgi:hypothetical protein